MTESEKTDRQYYLDHGLDPDDFYLGEEAGKRFDALFSQCLGVPAKDAAEQARRDDINRIYDKRGKSDRPRT